LHSWCSFSCVKKPVSSGSCAKEGGRKEALPVGKSLWRPSVEQLIASGSQRGSIANVIITVQRVPQGLINQRPSVAKKFRREVPADAVLWVVYEINENVDNIQRKISRISCQIYPYHPEAREELDPLKELPLSTLEDLLAFENALFVEKKSVKRW
jgi:hypothetical protein